MYLIVKRPFLWLLIALLGGMGMHSWHPLLLSFIICIISVGVILWLYHLISRKNYNLSGFCFLFLIPCIILFGNFLMKNKQIPHEMNHIFDDRISGVIIGQLKSIEDKEDYQVLTLKNNLIYINKSNMELNLKNNQLMDNQTYFPNEDFNKEEYCSYYSENIIIYNSNLANYKIGNTLSINGSIIRFQKATNPGQFDEEKYNQIQNIDYKVYSDDIEVINNNYSKYHHGLYRIRKKVFGVFTSLLPEKNGGILGAMILGDKVALDQDIKELYQQNGISHILAISGLHISLIGMTLFQLLRKLRISIPIATVLSLCLIFSYGILTNFSVSTSRAIMMLFILLIAKILGRTYDLLSATSFTAFITLIQNPLQIYSTGFLLSYGAVLGIGFIYPLFSDLIFIKKDVKFLDIFSKHFKVKPITQPTIQSSIQVTMISLIKSGIKSIFECIKISLSIQLMTIPILLYYFFEISTYSILINIIILPFVFLVIFLGIIGGILGVFILPFGAFFLGGANYILNFYEWICRRALILPENALVIGRPEASILITYYFILFLFILLNYWKKHKFSHVLLLFLFIIFIQPGSNHLEFTFLDVGQGDGIFFQTPMGTTYMVDGGSTSVNQVGKYRIIPFLKSKGIKKIDWAILTHLDSDHVSGIIEIMERMDNQGGTGVADLKYTGNVEIKNLVLPSVVEREDTMYLKLKSLAKEKGVRLLYMKKDDIIQEGDIVITCLHPQEEYYYSSANAISIVLDVKYHDFQLLLTGDIEENGEDLLYEVLSENLKEYKLLKVAHHGSKNSTDEEFLDIVNPAYSIISSGKNNPYGHPHDELLERLEKINSNIMMTMIDGAISVQTDGNLMKIKVYCK